MAWKAAPHVSLATLARKCTAPVVRRCQSTSRAVQVGISLQGRWRESFGWLIYGCPTTGTMTRLARRIGWSLSDYNIVQLRDSFREKVCNVTLCSLAIRSSEKRSSDAENWQEPDGCECESHRIVVGDVPRVTLQAPVPRARASEPDGNDRLAKEVTLEAEVRRRKHFPYNAEFFIFR